MKNKLSIVIVNWNTPGYLKKLLSLLFGDFGFEIIVVDNASNKPLDWVKKKYPEVFLIQNKFNRGYAAACNQGVLKAVGEWVLFLNPDVEITPRQIKQLVSYAEKNNLDACSVKTTDSYQKPLPSWLTLLIEFTPLNQVSRFLPRRYVGVEMTWGAKTLFGGCLLIKKSVIMSLGGFDERFFLWFEDSDLTKRLVEKTFKIGWAPLKIKHEGGISFKQLSNQFKRDIFFHSMDVYAKKHFNYFGQTVINLIKKRYARRKLILRLFDCVSITVPNLKTNLLKTFLQNNSQINSTSGVELIVVTSSIPNNDIWEWRRGYPEIRFISIEKNKGFASTVNIGFRVSTGTWVGTVNDDVSLSKDWLTKLLTCFDNSTGSINPVIKKPDGQIESAGIKVLPKGKAQPLTKYHMMTDRLTMVAHKCIEVDATNAAAVIYSKEALNHVGLFDERFGSYLEDIDLSLRLRRAGFKNKVCPNSVVTHLGQSSSKNLAWKKQYLDFKNWILVILKNWSLIELILNFPSIFIERVRNISGVLKSLI